MRGAHWCGLREAVGVRRWKGVDWLWLWTGRLSQKGWWTGHGRPGAICAGEARLRQFTPGCVGRVKLLACGSSHSVVATEILKVHPRPGPLKSPIMEWLPAAGPSGEGRGRRGGDGGGPARHGEERGCQVTI
ncbi:hypothetical protein CRUP_009950 [Coryphaenoides rupestris]|nr:hypothetical protein CRUP_009950 [Coryphaenoides rupestris]